eukprot:TRINITY_DN7480_c0_g1_i4.p1 TRINITY_DN7480_c0_g1~~TRINITY_DN7480_c0_g1_i4.p1  ORF type:complete len:275 (-),score=46.76 TRINITY_DN7480_c0_g1_i4:144-968(-)
MLDCARNKLSEVTEIVLKTLQDNPTYQLVFTGHSLGAGTCTLMLMLWRYAHPEIDSTCWGFGCPPNVTEDVSKTYLSNITTVVCRHDIIPRLSYGSLYDLKARVQLVLDKTSLANRLALLPFSTSTWARNHVKSLGITNEVIRSLKPNQKLVPPGRVLYLFGDQSVPCQIEAVEANLFDEIPLSSTLLMDHWPGRYEDFLLLSKKRVRKFAEGGHVHIFVSKWFPKPTWCEHCGKFIYQVFEASGCECEVCHYKIHKECCKFVEGSLIKCTKER